MRRTSLTGLLLLLVAGIMLVFYVQGERNAYSYSQKSNASRGVMNHALVGSASNSTPYIYYTLKQSMGFVLARAPKGGSGQPLGNPQPVASFSNGFGLAESDSVLTMQLSPDERYLAIDGTSDHGEQVWVYDTQQMTLNLVPAHVFGNFLHWIPTVGAGLASARDTFLYRPMLPLGPSAPLDGNSWNPGLWEVDAATGAHRNIDIGVPSAYLVDAVSSPDATHIIYSTSVGLGMGSATWSMNSNGSGITHLFSSSQSIAALFTWSPDGQKIAYELLSDSPTPFLPAGLWIMNGSGGQQQHVADADGGHGYVPVWSPDSRKIAFVMRTNVGNRQADLQVQALQCAIAVVDVAAGSSWVVASASQTAMQLNYNPSWTADSASITFTASNSVNTVIGGMPRYWSARATSPHMQPAVTPLTPALAHVIANS